MEDTGAGVTKIGRDEFGEEFCFKVFTGRAVMTTAIRIDHIAEIFECGKVRDIDGNVTESRFVEVHVDCHALGLFEEFSAHIYYALELPREFDKLKKLQSMFQTGSIYYINCASFNIFPENNRPVVFYHPLLVPVPQDEYQEWVKYFSL